MNLNDVLIERGSTHGNWKFQSAFSQQLKDAVHHAAGYGRLSDSARESIDMICVKISRIVSGNPNEPDHWKDIAGYATLVLKELENDPT